MDGGLKRIFVDFFEELVQGWDFFFGKLGNFVMKKLSFGRRFWIFEVKLKNLDF
jgi:hypothetical protein